MSTKDVILVIKQCGNNLGGAPGCRHYAGSARARRSTGETDGNQRPNHHHAGAG